MANATLFILPIMGMVAVQRHGCGKMILCIESPCVFVFELVAPWLGGQLKNSCTWVGRLQSQALFLASSLSRLTPIKSSIFVSAHPK